MTTTLLTGLPRSGTTLLCVLLNELPNTLALAEPIQHWTGTPEEMVATIDRFVEETRACALVEGLAPSMSIAGQVPDNFTEASSSATELRRWLATTVPIPVGKPLSEDFRLYIKHPAGFTALASRLARRYPVFAIVRHPLAALASWQTIDIALNRGRAPVAELFDPGLRATLDRTGDRLERQIALLSWYLQRFSEFPEGHVLRYEDLVGDPVAALARLHPAPRPLLHAVRNERIEDRYPGVDLRLLARSIAPMAPLARRFYPDFEAGLEPYLVEPKS